MLLYHIQALHPSLEVYTCPHCTDDSGVPFDDLEFHLRCHGDLLFKCGHCLSYHWQKRTAEAHVAQLHPGAKQFVRDVRAERLRKDRLTEEEAERRKLEKQDLIKHANEAGKEVALQKEAPRYLPYKCGLCEESAETGDEIKEHCVSSHGLDRQFRCSLCEYSGEEMGLAESHFAEAHPEKPVLVLRAYFIDQYGDACPSAEERREPLWRRDMPGVRHIRGILYDNGADGTILQVQHAPRLGKKSNQKAGAPNSGSGDLGAGIDSQAQGPDDDDEFPMSCKECGIQKKTIKGLKMHIKLLHLRTGKFR